MRSTSEIAVRQQAMKARLKETKRQREARLREEKAFRRIDRYLAQQEEAVEAERRVTAMYGIPSSWQAIDEWSKYWDMRSLSGFYQADFRARRRQRELETVETNDRVVGRPWGKWTNKLPGKLIIHPGGLQKPVTKDLQADSGSRDLRQNKLAA